MHKRAAQIKSELQACWTAGYENTLKQRLRMIWDILNTIPFLSTLLSMGWNMTFALVNSLISLFYTSYWHLTLFAFYFVLAMM